MRASNRKRMRRELMSALVLMLLSTVLPTSVQSVGAQTLPPATGIVCTTGPSPNPTFTLTTNAG